MVAVLASGLPLAPSLGFCYLRSRSDHAPCSRWVAHPALVPVAKQIFDEHMKTPNQIHVARDDVQKGAADLLEVRLPAREIPRGPCKPNAV